MLELRPSCEHCQRLLPPQATEPKHRPVDAQAHAALAEKLRNIAPQER